jgi:3-oxoacyl-[acyl-carrier protein] reductase
MPDLTGRIALVTGASRGIGRAVAVALAEAGADVAINYRQMEKEARSTKEQIKTRTKRAVTVRADVSSRVEVTRMIRTVQNKLGPIDILINNAGMANPKGLEDITEEDWDETMSINLKSAFLVTQAVIPDMRERRWGRIINITSGAAYTGGIVGPHYSASKAGMEGLTRAYAALLVKEGITVNAIAPSIIETDMIKKGKDFTNYIPVGRMGQPDEVAQAVVFAVGNAYMTGQSILLNGGRYFH